MFAIMEMEGGNIPIFERCGAAEQSRILPIYLNMLNTN